MGGALVRPAAGGGGGARGGPGVLPARLHRRRAARAALPLRAVPLQATRHQDAADLARAAHTGNCHYLFFHTEIFIRFDY